MTTDDLGRFYPWLGEGQHHLVVDIGQEQYIYEVIVEENGKYIKSSKII